MARCRQRVRSASWPPDCLPANWRLPASAATTAAPAACTEVPSWAVARIPSCFFFQAEDGIRGGRVTEFRRVLFRSENLMPHILDAVRAYATEGEIMQAMIEVFGTYTETAVV